MLDGTWTRNEFRAMLIGTAVTLVLTAGLAALGGWMGFLVSKPSDPREACGMYFMSVLIAMGIGAMVMGWIGFSTGVSTIKSLFRRASAHDARSVKD
ncbi:MAG TPA: hypothetical protein VNC50_19930 [Planctomycetia bacterium]|nr:hypothetical protein [Planctomycetia bacterium]